MSTGDTASDSGSLKTGLGLKRLPRPYYQGRAWVHWSMTIENRAKGWLDPLHHARLREAMLHTLTRYRLACPVYCLMPDHGHFLWGGLAEGSDQIPAAKFFRQEWNRLLGEAPRSPVDAPVDAPVETPFGRPYSSLRDSERPKDAATEASASAATFKLQHQPYDHVLRENERGSDNGAFSSVAHYILQNPVRAKLVAEFKDWPYLGTIVPTYPRIDPRDEDFWDRYWQMHHKVAENYETPRIP